MTKLSLDALKLRLSQIRLLVLDVDGVLTDGGIYLLDNGSEFKRFNVKDGLGIQNVLQAGIEVAVITASASDAISHRMKKLGVRHVFTDVESKEIILENLMKCLDVQAYETAYIGDDLTDMNSLQLVGVPITVQDAMADVKAQVEYITQLSGGQGAVREICDLIISNK